MRIIVADNQIGQTVYLTEIILAASLGVFIGCIFRVSTLLMATIGVLAVSVGVSAGRDADFGESALAAGVCVAALQIGYLAGLLFRAILRKR